MSYLVPEGNPLDMLVQYELLLNASLKKRYHIDAGDDWKFSLSEIIKGKKRYILLNKGYDVLLGYLRKHVKVILDESGKF